jgi:hypothetical protein
MAMMVAMMDRRAVMPGFNAILFDVLKLHKKKEVYNRRTVSCQTRDESPGRLSFPGARIVFGCAKPRSLV